MFILNRDRPNNSLEEWKSGWDNYQQYLKSISSRLPDSALAYALAEWHYNHLEHRAPHDAWLQKLEILGLEGGEGRNCRIVATFLGAYHDGIISLEYLDVLSYSICSSAENLGDWQYDEIRLSEDGKVIHEIEFDRGTWLIICRDMNYRWRDISVPPDSDTARQDVA
jgi:hypothetical protein